MAAGGLYAGYVPNLIRNSIISASELVACGAASMALTSWPVRSRLGPLLSTLAFPPYVALPLAFLEAPLRSAAALANPHAQRLDVRRYDCSKNALAEHASGTFLASGPPQHMASGLAAGFVATVLGSPMDVVSTRIMSERRAGPQLGLLAQCAAIARTEGLGAFYQVRARPSLLPRLTFALAPDCVRVCDFAFAPETRVCSRSRACAILLLLGDKLRAIGSVLYRYERARIRIRVHSCRGFAPGPGALHLHSGAFVRTRAHTRLTRTQGFIPNFARIGAFNVVLWMSYEQLAALAAPS